MSSVSEPIDSRIKVVTPENIAFNYQIAGPFRRLAAFLLDLGIRFAVLLGLWMIFACSGIVFGIAGINLMDIGIAILTLAYFVLDWFYGSLFETFWNGQTPGKRLLSLRVLSADGEPINALQAFGRNLLRYADMMPLVPVPTEYLQMSFGTHAFLPTFLVGLIVPLFSKRFQRLGDLVCGTMVVIEDRSWLMKVAKVEDDRARLLAEFIPANYVVRRSLSKAIATYVERRRYFTTARRREIARHLAQPMLAKFDLPEDTSYDLLLCAVYYRTFLSDQSADGTSNESEVLTNGPAQSSSNTLDLSSFKPKIGT
ncbi:MAG: RDD family protein [Pirellulales bacterium]